MSSLSDGENSGADADAGLLRRLASGDRDALDALYRRHEDYARRVAMAVSGGNSVVADDLMAEAFAAVFRRAGSNAPIVNFRAYLSACIRNAHLGLRREGAQSVAASDQPWLFDAAVDDPHLVDNVASEQAVAAMAALPVRWRELLWQTEVEGRSNAEVAALMGKSHSAVSSMAHRAREALRRGFLDRHVPTTDVSACRWTRQRLSRFVRSELSDRAADRVRSHVSECATCASVLRDLESVNRRIGVSLWPILLVGAGPTLPVLAGAEGSSPTPPSDPGSGPLAALTGSSPAVVGTVVATVAAAVVAAGAVAMNLIGADDADPARDRPAAMAPGAANGLDQPPADEPPAGQVPGPAIGLPAAAANERPSKRASDEEDEEDDKDEDPSDSPPTPTPTPPPTYDASIGSVDKSDVSSELTQSIIFDVDMTSSGRRTGVVLNLAITIDEQQFSVEQFSGSGWSCRIEPNGENLADHLGDQYVFDPGTEFTCTYEFPDEDAPSQLDWDLELPGVDGVAGSVRVSVVGEDDPKPGNDSASF